MVPCFPEKLVFFSNALPKPEEAQGVCGCPWCRSWCSGGLCPPLVGRKPRICDPLAAIRLHAYLNNGCISNHKKNLSCKTIYQHS